MTEERSRTYTCEFCNAVGLKEDWGPGRITCPSCGKRALTVAETLPNIRRNAGMLNAQKCANLDDFQ